jgi:hypothetical protein
MRSPSCLCVSVSPLNAARQRGLLLEERRDRPSSAGVLTELSRAADLLLLPLRRRVNVVCVERLPNASGRTEERTLSVTLKRV